MNALLPSSSAPRRVGPKIRKPSRSKRIDDAEDERLLGPDDGEIDLVRSREVPHGVDALGGDVDVLRDRGGAGVAGRAEEPGHARAARELPRQRVLAAPPPIDQDTHASAGSAAGR